MTHNVSRRTLAKGAAWAAPAVVATAAIPAYAASRTECPSDIANKMRAAFDSYVTDVKAADPAKNLDGVTVRTWWRNVAGRNGNGAQTMQHAIEIDGLTGAPLTAQEGGSFTAPIKLTYAVRNVDTSYAVNNLSDRMPVGLGRGTYGDRNVMLNPWRPWGNWNVRTGEFIENQAVNNVATGSVDNGSGEQRDWAGNTYTDYRGRLYSPTGEQLGNGISIDETLTTDAGKWREWVAVPGNTRAVLSGTPTVLQYTNLGMANNQMGTGKIYIAFGVKPMDVITAPEYSVVAEKVLAVDPTVSDDCLLDAYNAELVNWETRNDRFGGATFLNSGWGSGVIADTVYSGSDFVWSHETGAFEGSENDGHTMGSLTLGDDPLTYFDQQWVGATAGRDTTLGYQLDYYDGIW